MQSVASPTADAWVASLIPKLFHTFVNNFYGHCSPSADSRRVVVSYKRKYVHDLSTG